MLDVSATRNWSSCFNLTAYLDRYLPRLDLRYDQDWALGALRCVDLRLGTSHADRVPRTRRPVGTLGRLRTPASGRRHLPSTDRRSVRPVRTWGCDGRGGAIRVVRVGAPLGSAGSDGSAPTTGRSTRPARRPPRRGLPDDGQVPGGVCPGRSLRGRKPGVVTPR
ncbi:DUF6000 family protein [Micromonospora chalcea]|uniref:DUF6000 family protein n=1 Tax=Micromonospora chalcea TaxID=1874 RepID=UPI0037978682